MPACDVDKVQQRDDGGVLPAEARTTEERQATVLLLRIGDDAVEAAQLELGLRLELALAGRHPLHEVVVELDQCIRASRQL